MNRGLNLFAIVLFSVSIAFTQAPTPTPVQRQGGPPSVTADNASFERLRSIEMIAPRKRATDHPLLNPNTGIYRKLGKRETEILAVAAPVLSKYTAFLKEPDTGIVKLSGSSECVSDTGLIAANEKCIPYKMPGAGIAYSFRMESYRLPRLADLILHEGVFKTGGALQQVMIVNLGDVPIEDATLKTNGMNFLVETDPVKDSDEFTRNEEKIIEGIERDGFIYRKGALVQENCTYALRSIAYRGKYIRSIDNVTYDEMDFDRRRDVIVAFRVVEKEDNGDITIVWKRLKDVASPKLKVK